MITELLAFDAKLTERIAVEMVRLDRICFDEQLEALIDVANPFGSLRSVSDNSLVTAYPFNMLAYQSPMIGYKYRNRYKILAGAFTVKMLKTAQATGAISDQHLIPVFVLTKKPSDAIRLQIAQFDLANNLISKCFVSESKKIGHFLKAWFKKQEGRKSIYQSDEWLCLYPELNTSGKLAEFLSISKKDL